jgi:predicted amidohydrolase
MRETAASHNAAVCGSLIVVQEQQFYNRFVCAFPSGDLTCYDKRHLFRLAGEQNHYTAGETQVTFELNGWRICPMVCYDLRFPVFSRNIGDYDLLVYVANWPAKRRLHWRQLLIARAIENQACVLGVNRIGEDAKGLTYSGDSLAITAQGELLLDMQNDSGAARVTLDSNALLQYRENFPCHRDADRFHMDD